MQHENCKRTERQERYMKFSEDYMRFLDGINDTIREMIDDELDRRARQSESVPPPITAPPESPTRRTLWQRLVSLFTL